MAGRVVIEWCRGRVKVYLPNGAQSPKLWPEEVRPWLDAGGLWDKHAIQGWPTAERGSVYDEAEFLASLDA